MMGSPRQPSTSLKPTETLNRTAPGSSSDTSRPHPDRPGYSPARSRMTWSSSGSSEKCGILLAHSTRVKSCLSAAWQMLVTGSFGCGRGRGHSVRTHTRPLRVLDLWGELNEGPQRDPHHNS
jgi:hypothetical protein